MAVLMKPFVSILLSFLLQYCSAEGFASLRSCPPCQGFNFWGECVPDLRQLGCDDSSLLPKNQSHMTDSEGGLDGGSRSGEDLLYIDAGSREVGSQEEEKKMVHSTINSREEGNTELMSVGNKEKRSDVHNISVENGIVGDSLSADFNDEKEGYSTSGSDSVEIGSGAANDTQLHSLLADFDSDESNDEEVENEGSETLEDSEDDKKLTHDYDDIDIEADDFINSSIPAIIVDDHWSHQESVERNVGGEMVGITAEISTDGWGISENVVSSEESETGVLGESDFSQSELEHYDDRLENDMNTDYSNEVSEDEYLTSAESGIESEVVDFNTESGDLAEDDEEIEDFSDIEYSDEDDVEYGTQRRPNRRFPRRRQRMNRDQSRKKSERGGKWRPNQKAGRRRFSGNERWNENNGRRSRNQGRKRRNRNRFNGRGFSSFE